MENTVEKYPSIKKLKYKNVVWAIHNFKLILVKTVQKWGKRIRIKEFVYKN